MRNFFIDKNGNIALDLIEFQGAGTFSEGLATFRTSQYLSGYIDKKGTIIIKPQFDFASPFSQGLATVRIVEKSLIYRNIKWAVIDKDGKRIFEIDCDRLYSFSGNIAVAERAGKYCFVNRRGETVHSIDKNKFYIDSNIVRGFSEGLIAVRNVEKKKCGFMDKTGKFVIEPKFKDAANFSEGLARVSIKENHREYLGFINPEGEFVIEPKFDIDCDFLRCTNDFSEGWASLIAGPPTMGKSQNFMYIDKSGEIVLRTEFFRAECFHEGLAVVWDERTDRYGYIDKSGKLAIPLKYAWADNFSEGLASITL